MYFKIWDKKEKINGATANEVLNSLSYMANDTIILINNSQNDRTEYIESDIVLRQILGLDMEVSADVVGAKYVEHLENERVKMENEIEEKENALMALEEENAQIIKALVMGGLM